MDINIYSSLGILEAEKKIRACKIVTIGPEVEIIVLCQSVRFRHLLAMFHLIS